MQVAIVDSIACSKAYLLGLSRSVRSHVPDYGRRGGLQVYTLKLQGTTLIVRDEAGDVVMETQYASRNKALTAYHKVRKQYHIEVKTNEENS